VIGGGGGGGAGRGGGGGAGGLIYNNAFPVSSGQTYTVVVGVGGASATGIGNSGTNSTFYNITAIGGGGGGKSGGDGTGLTGGSGGGAGDDSSGSYSGGAGTGSQGFAGGMSNKLGAKESGGGGGGASAVGSPGIVGTGGTGGDGGDGLSYGISGTTTYYAGGGGAGSGYSTGALKGVGGLGGGGSGSQHSINVGSVAVLGTINTGGGGGGGTYSDGIRTNGAAGGSGIVIIRYAKFDSIFSDGWFTVDGPTSVALGSSFTLPVYSPSDGVTVTGTDTFDVNTAGTYTVTYAVEGKASVVRSFVVELTFRYLGFYVEPTGSHPNLLEVALTLDDGVKIKYDKREGIVVYPIATQAQNSSQTIDKFITAIMDGANMTNYFEHVSIGNGIYFYFDLNQWSVYPSVSAPTTATIWTYPGSSFEILNAKLYGTNTDPSSFTNNFSPNEWDFILDMTINKTLDNSTITSYQYL